MFSKLLKSISDDELLQRLSGLVHESRRVESELVAHIAEVDERRLYAREACSSMFTYCTDVLHMSEAEAYLRIRVARASRKHPELLRMLEDGRIHLTGAAKLSPYLTEANRGTVLPRAAHKSKAKIEELVAEVAPKPDVTPKIRKLPAPARLRPDAVVLPTDSARRASSSFAEAERRRKATAPRPVEPLAPERYKVQFTASAELKDKIERLRALMPDSDLAVIIDEAVTEKLKRLESRRYGKTRAPRRDLRETDTSPSSRYIPAPVRRAVSERDGYQCAFMDANGQRCNERSRLQFHHRQAFARGGDNSPENLQVMCPTHNQYLADCEYGTEVMERHRGAANKVREPEPTYLSTLQPVQGILTATSPPQRECLRIGRTSRPPTVPASP